MGLGNQLVGISHECDYPASILSLPRLSSPRLNPLAPSERIHQEVQERVKQGLSLYDIDAAKLAELKPDLVITQDQCDVCAVSLKDVEKAVCQWTGSPTKLLSLRPYLLREIEKSFAEVGAATGHEFAAKQLQHRFRDKLKAVEAAVRPATTWPRVLNLEWLEPPIVGGGWIPELVRIAGGVPVVVSEPTHFLKTTWPEIQSLNPEIIAIYPCGFDVKRTLEEMRQPAILEKLMTLRAAREGKIYVCDGNAYFNRSGPRIADSAELLAGLFHPELGRAYREKHKNFFSAWAVT
jgi:iron complex transport system substrate-binding protein